MHEQNFQKPKNPNFEKSQRYNTGQFLTLYTNLNESLKKHVEREMHGKYSNELLEKIIQKIQDSFESTLGSEVKTIVEEHSKTLDGSHYWIRLEISWTVGHEKARQGPEEKIYLSDINFEVGFSKYQPDEKQV